MHNDEKCAPSRQLPIGRDSTRWMLLSQVIELSVSHELFCLCSNTPTLRKASFNILAWPSLCFVGTEAALCPHLGKAGQREAGGWKQHF